MLYIEGKIKHSSVVPWALTWSVDISRAVLWTTLGRLQWVPGKSFRAVVWRLCIYEPNTMVFLSLRLIYF